MHNRQIMVLSKAECRGIFREHACPQQRFESQMEQKIPSGPSWARAKWDFLLHLERRPDPGAAAGHRPPALADSAAEEAGGAHRRSLRRPVPAPPHRAAGTARIWVPRTKRGPPFGGPLGDLEAKPGFEPGVKALQASALPLGHFAVDMKRADSKTGPMHAMERTTGLEPATPTLARLCSTN